MAEAKVEFLWNAANGLLSERYGSIRSNLISRCQDYARNQINLPKKIFDISSMCEYCSSPWQHGQYSTKVVPTSKKIKTILAKLEKKKSNKCNISPSRVQKLKNSSGNKLVMTCGVCKHKNVIRLQKPSRPSESVPEVLETTPCVSKKNKKKKDKFAGLSVKAVLSATPKDIQSKKRLSFKADINDGKAQNNSNLPKTPNQASKLNKKPTIVPVVTPQSIIKKHIHNKSNKSKVLLKVDNNKQIKNDNSIKTLAEILRKNKNKEGNNNSRLKQLMK